MTREWLLPIFALFIIVVGLVTLNSAADFSLVRQQLISLAIGAGAAVGVAMLGRQRLMRLATGGYALALILLVLTMFIGQEANNARSWLKLGPLPRFQPSEFAKIALLLSLAAAMHNRPLNNIVNYLRPLVLMLVPLTLVFLEPDLGSTLVLAAIGLGMMLFRGDPWKLLANA